MFVQDYVTGFYQAVYKANCRVLLLVAPNVDALCACRILQSLFHYDNIPYTLVPVHGLSSLLTAYKQHGEQFKQVVMINCGAACDLMSFLEAKEDVNFYVADSHRPIHVNNVYNGKQIHLIMPENEEENIPSFEQIFREEDSDEDEELVTEEQLERRREKRIWAETRLKILFDYSQFSFYGMSASVTMYKVASKMSKTSNELRWWAIVGLTEQFIRGQIEADRFALEVGNFQLQVVALRNQGGDDNLSIDCLKISYDTELQLSLYRHWSLLESLKHTMYSACKFKLWTQKGQKRLLEFFAELGLPLSQCKQKYVSMDINLRNHLKEWIDGISEKYDLLKITNGSFIAQYGYRHKFVASDVSLAASALLESSDQEKSQADKFLIALDSLSKSNVNLLEKGIEQAKLQLTAIFKQIQSLIDTHGVISAGPYLYAVIPESCPDARYFCHPTCLTELAKFLLNAHVSSTKSRKARNLPLVLVTPHPDRENVSLVVGIPPVSEESSRNFFGKAFEQAALRVKSTIEPDYFDISVALIHGEDRSKFFDALITLLS